MSLAALAAISSPAPNSTALAPPPAHSPFATPDANLPSPHCSPIRSTNFLLPLPSPFAAFRTETISSSPAPVTSCIHLKYPNSALKEKYTTNITNRMPTMIRSFRWPASFEAVFSPPRSYPTTPYAPKTSHNLQYSTINSCFTPKNVNILETIIMDMQSRQAPRDNSQGA